MRAWVLKVSPFGRKWVQILTRRRLVLSHCSYIKEKPSLKCLWSVSKVKSMVSNKSRVVGKGVQRRGKRNEIS